MLYETSTIIEIICGREGMFGIRNRNMMPTGAAVMLRNATLEDHSFRTGGGAAKIGTSIGPGIVILAAIDYWPIPGTQRTVVACSDGTIRKDDGSGSNWITLASGLTMTGAIPYFAVGGAEAAGKNRKLFYADGVNAPKYLDGDANTMTTFNPSTQSAADWTGTSQPAWFVIHEGYLWAGGCRNTPHTIYRCTNRTDHTDFRSATTYSFPVFAGEGERIVMALSYKGGLLLWKYPEGVYFFDTSSPVSGDWRAIKAGQPGAAGPWNGCAVEDDVVWVSPDGGWHLISATQATGSVRASDITHRKLVNWMRENVNLARLDTAMILYYSDKQEVILACNGIGSSNKDRRLHMDVALRTSIGERWIWWDRDRNEAIFLRKVNSLLIPCFGDGDGQLWRLDTANRNKDGLGYTFEWFLKDDDFSAAVPGWQGRKKNLRFIQVEYDPRSATTYTIEVFRDGVKKQTVSIPLQPSGPVLGTPSATLPFMIGGGSIQMTVRKRLQGQCVRLALRGLTSGADQDISITRILVGLDLAG